MVSSLLNLRNSFWRPEMDAKILQQFGDNMHQGLNDQDQLIIEQCQRLQDALKIRVTSSMKMREGQRTIRTLGAQITASLEARDKLIAAHASAQKDQETMGWPEVCPWDQPSAKAAKEQESAL